MILSNLSIHDALDRGYLVIEPEPNPRQKTRPDQHCPYQTSAVDLTLANELVRLRPGLGIEMDLKELRDGAFSKLAKLASERISISDDQPFRLERGQFVLGKTVERIRLPITSNPGTPCLAARVEGRSSFARCGLLVHFTAPTIHAGFEGTITLEFCNLGPYAISLRPNIAVCQLIIEQVDRVPFRNDSQFQGQLSPEGHA